jgi:hypothetical protein
MAALILWGLRLWPGIALGEIAVLNFVQPAGTILGQAVGNTLEVVIAALFSLRLQALEGAAIATLIVVLALLP